MKFKNLVVSILVLLIAIAFAACEKAVTLGEFGLKTPIDIYTGISTLPTLTWEASENAATYELTIAKSEDLTDSSQIFSDINKTQYTFTSELDYETVYYWSVKAYSEDKKTTLNCSKNYSFTTEFASLEDFSLMTPSNDSKDVELEATFTWESVADDATYTLKISRTEDFSGELAYYENITTNSYTLRSALSRNITYYWYVSATSQGRTKDSDVFSFKTKDVAIDDFEGYDAESFATIYKVKEGESGQSISTSLETEPWEDCDNGNSIKISGSNLYNWGYLQILGTYDQMDLSGYDGITFKIYPKTTDERLGLIMHVVNGAYPNDCLLYIVLKGNAPTTVTIPFDSLILRDTNTIGEFNNAYVTGLCFTVESSGKETAFGGTGFSGTYPSFELYIDDICGYNDDSITSIQYEAAYKNEFELKNIDTSDNDNIGVTFTKSGASSEYTILVSENSDLSSPLISQNITAQFEIVGGIPVCTEIIDISLLESDKKYYVVVSCGDYLTEIKTFETIEVLSCSIDFESVTSTSDLEAMCSSGMLNSNSIISYSETGGVEDSKCIKFAAASADSDTTLKGLWDFKDFDYINFYYNIPSGNANFYLRFYLTSSYSERAYLDFSSSEARLSGSGYLTIPMDSSYFSFGGSGDASMFEPNNITAIGFFIKLGSQEFYIDNFTLLKSNALPESIEMYQAAQIRNAMAKLSDGTYQINILRSYTPSAMTLYPFFNKEFDIENGECSLLESEFEDLFNDERNYIYTVIDENVDIVLFGELNVQNSLTIDFENYADLIELTADTSGIFDTVGKLSLSETGGFNDSKALLYAGGSECDTIIKELWDYPDYDYIQFYYNVPSGNADFFLRFYLSSAYSERAYLDFNVTGAKLSGSGFLRIPIDSAYFSFSSATEISSEAITGFGVYIKSGSSNFYIDNITLLKEEALSYNNDLTDVTTLRTGLTTITSGSGYSLVIEKSYIASSTRMVLFPVVSKVFDTSADILESELEETITTGSYIYTVYNSDGLIIGSGKLTIE